MNPGRTSRKAEAFAAALEGAAVTDPSVAALLGVAERLSNVPLRPAPDFSAALRAQLVAETAGAVAAAPAAVAPAAAAPAAGLPAWVGGTATQLVTGALAVAVGVTATGVGASRALPGDLLYPVKQAAERLQVAFADDALDQADALAEHVLTRLDEISAMLEGLSLPLDPDVERRIADALRDLRRDLDELTELLLRELADGAAEAGVALAEITAEARLRLSGLAAALPPSIGDAAYAAVGALETVEDEADRIAGATPGPDPEPSTPPTTPSPSRPPTDPPTIAPTPSDIPTLPVETPSLPVQTPSLPVQTPTVPVPTGAPVPTSLLPL